MSNLPAIEVNLAELKEELKRYSGFYNKLLLLNSSREILAVVDWNPGEFDEKFKDSLMIGYTKRWGIVSRIQLKKNYKFITEFQLDKGIEIQKDSQVQVILGE